MFNTMDIMSFEDTVSPGQSFLVRGSRRPLCRRFAQLLHAMGEVFVWNSVLRRIVLTTATSEQCTSPPASRQSSEWRELKVEY